MSVADIWDVYAHGLDMNKYWPGVYELVLAIWMATARVVYRRNGMTGRQNHQNTACDDSIK
ncbi:MAG: hypothetical protein PHW95_02080 [Patescibacteria group bacterium]|nr:hypothetical protein [Patescibacteria group bacterium]